MNINAEDLKNIASGYASKEKLLNEACERAFYFFADTDGNYNISESHPQAAQILKLVLAANYL